MCVYEMPYKLLYICIQDTVRIYIYMYTRHRMSIHMCVYKAPYRIRDAVHSWIYFFENDLNFFFY